LLRFKSIRTLYRLAAILALVAGCLSFIIPAFLTKIPIILIVCSIISYFFAGLTAGSTRDLFSTLYRDKETGRPNRFCLSYDWDRLVKGIGLARVDISFVMFRCDEWEYIKDSCGEDLSSDLITMILAQIKSTIREGDKIYRLNDDDYIAVLYNVNAEKAKMIVERGLPSLYALNTHEAGINRPPNLCVGISSRTRKIEYRDLKIMMKEADIALAASIVDPVDDIKIYGDAMEENKNENKNCEGDQ